jgi:hypothetical protein
VKTNAWAPHLAREIHKEAFVQNFWSLFAAYMAFWAIFFIYDFTVARRLARVEKDLARMKRQISEQ